MDSLAGRASVRALTEEQRRPQPRSAEEAPGAPAVAEAMTPMMAQYAQIKAAHPGCLLFYRMGDFFELFFEDAVEASQALGIQLTKRGKHQGEDIPMCGVPVMRSDEYLQKLIAAGFRIAVCEQLEDPAEAKKRGGKSVVKRDVVRLVTPGHDHRRSAARCRLEQFPHRAVRPPSMKASMRSRRSISPPANAWSANAALPISPASWRGWRRKRCCWRQASTATRSCAA